MHQSGNPSESVGSGVGAGNVTASVGEGSELAPDAGNNWTLVFNRRARRAGKARKGFSWSSESREEKPFPVVFLGPDPQFSRNQRLQRLVSWPGKTFQQFHECFESFVASVFKCEVSRVGKRLKPAILSDFQREALW